MKIHADKIESDPQHGLHVGDVRRILAAVPHAWIVGLKEVRLANSREYHSPYAFFSRFDGGLTIYSRCGTKREVLAAVLSALVVDSLGINRGLGCRHTDAEKRQIGELIQPLVDELLTTMTPLKKLSPGAHTPLHFAPFPNDAA